jgi:hypothetical protein
MASLGQMAGATARTGRLRFFDELDIFAYQDFEAFRVVPRQEVMLRWRKTRLFVFLIICPVEGWPVEIQCRETMGLHELTTSRIGGSTVTTDPEVRLSTDRPDPELTRFSGRSTIAAKSCARSTPSC